MDTSSYVLPCCSSCQILITANFEFNVLVEQQAKLADQINKNTEVMHRSTVHQNNVTIIHDAVDRLEVLLVDVQKQLMASNSGGNINTSTIKNHVTSLFNIAMQETNQNICTKMHAMMSDIANGLKSFKDEITQVSSIVVNIASGSPMCNNPMLGIEIMDELKSLSANINSIESKIISSSPDSIDSLEYELSNMNPIQVVVQSGWRLLGTRKVWKADWTDYDKRKLYRKKQQKQAEVAKKRKKQANNNITHHNRIYDRNDNRNHCNSYNENYATTNHCNYNNTNINNKYNQLPPDRELLATAKDRFSRPPPSHRTINFQRGEILNPYPAGDAPSFPSPSAPAHLTNWNAPGALSAAPCVACTCKHSCFPLN